jgi:RNA polymerase sigma-70 factor, ECF subfamily
MRVDETAVLAAMGGGRREFEDIVRAYEGAIYAFCLSSSREAFEAEDAAQEIFIKVLVGLRDLRDPGRFESWLYAVARRELASRGRARARRPPLADTDPDELGAEDAAAPEAADSLGALFAALSGDQATAVALRYGAGLSVRETALACGVAASVAKSRLHEALERMRAAGTRRLSRGLVEGAPFRIPVGLEVRIMESVETLRLGARIVERMAIYDQARLAALAAKGERMDEQVLSAMGRIDGGTEFVRRSGACLGAAELGAVLSYASRDAEARLVEELERVDPVAAESLKRNTIVFEDLSLFEEAAMDLVVRELGVEILAQGLSACEPRERGLVLDRMGEGERSRVAAALRGSAASPRMARAAQEEAVSLVRRLELEGRIEVLTGAAAGPRGERVALR